MCTAFSMRVHQFPVGPSVNRRFSPKKRALLNRSSPPWLPDSSRLNPILGLLDVVEDRTLPQLLEYVFRFRRPFPPFLSGLLLALPTRASSSSSLRLSSRLSTAVGSIFLGSFSDTLSPRGDDALRAVTGLFVFLGASLRFRGIFLTCLFVWCLHFRLVGGLEFFFVASAGG